MKTLLEKFMPKIKGKFAPLMDLLAEDDRWLLHCSDSQKLLYQLVLFTIYTTNGTAPDNPRYYKVRYNLRQRYDRVTADLEHIKNIFPKLICTEKKLSLVNAVAYRNRVTPEGSLELEKEIEKEVDKIIYPKFLKKQKTPEELQMIEDMKKESELRVAKANGKA